MNKKSLAKKIFNFKKNKKKITEEVTQLDEILGMGDLKSDEGLGNLQDILSGASLFLPGRARTIAAGLAAAVNMGRTELDKSGIVPSKSGNLETQGQILMGRALGLGTRNRNTPNPNTRNRNTRNRNTGNTETFGQNQHHAQTAVLFGALGNRANPLLGLGAVASGQSNNKFDDMLAFLSSSELARRHSDDVSNLLGIPGIPGISDRLTKKEPLSTRRTLDVARSADTLSLIAAANARR